MRHKMKSLRLNVNGINMGMIIHGEPRERQQTLVLLHGFTGCSLNWSQLCIQLETPERCLIMLDMLGHGQSDAPDEPTRYSIEHCQNDILAALETSGVQPGQAVLLGYSMGGRIALSTAFSHFFRGLILESASPGLSDPAERAQRQLSDNALAERIEREGIEKFIDYWEKLPLFASQATLPAETRAALHAQRLHNRPAGLANSLRGVGTGVQPAFQQQLGTLNLPVLLLAGELDHKFSQIARQMARQLPQARLHIVPASGHTIHLEQPGSFARQIHEFCQTVC
jgi:2-succinyl-6-hydroxy-2,4-cyclohexadiene-1-carboxylate synthase